MKHSRCAFSRLGCPSGLREQTVQMVSGRTPRSHECGDPPTHINAMDLGGQRSLTESACCWLGILHTCASLTTPQCSCIYFVSGDSSHPTLYSHEVTENGLKNHTLESKAHV